MRRPPSREVRFQAADLAAQVMHRAPAAKTSVAMQYLALCRMIETYLTEGFDAALMIGAPQGDASK